MRNNEKYSRKKIKFNNIENGDEKSWGFAWRYFRYS